MADREIRLVGSFTDGITPKLKKLNAQIKQVTDRFTKMQSKLRPIAREMGVLAMASERFATALKSQRSAMESSIRTMRQYRREVGALNRSNRSVTTGLQMQKSTVDTSVRALNQYRTAVGKVIAAQKRMKPTLIPPSSPLPRRPVGGGAPMVPRGGQGRGAGMVAGGGAGIADIAIGSAIGGIITNAVVSGFQRGVDLMIKPFRAFGSAFAERIGDEMEDIKSAGGMFALDKKNKTPLFSSFEDAMAMQEGLNRSLAKSAAALPGATGDYVKAARGLTDTVMGAFGKNEEAFKKFATELGAKEGATSEEAITKVLQRFTEQTVLLGQGQTGGMPLTMLMEQLVTREQVSIQSMQARYAQLRSNPLLANMLQDAEKEINASTAGTADRFKAVMKALDNALPQEVVNKMRRSVSGLIEAARSSFLDPDTGLFGLSRELNVMIPKVNQFGQYVDKNGKVVATASEAVEEATSLFKILKETLANFAVPILELLGVLPQIFDSFAQIAEQFKGLREVSNRFFLAFNTYTNGFEDQAKSFFDAASKATDPKIKSQLERQANMLKEQASSRGALGALNKAMLDFGAIGVKEYENNIKQLTDFDPKAIEKFSEKGMAEMAKNLLGSLVNSDLVAVIVETIGQALGAVIDTAFTAIDGILTGIESKTGNKLIDAFSRGFSNIITPERANQIADIIDRLLTKLFNMAADIIVNKVIPAIGYGILKTIEAAWNAGPMGKFLVVIGALTMFQKAVMAAQAALQTMAAVRGGAFDALAGVTGGRMGPGRMRGRPQVMARQGVRGARNMLQAATAAPAGAVTGLAQKGGLLSFLGGAGGKNFMAGLKAVSPKLMIFGGVLSAIIALFEGKGIAGALAEGLGAAGGSAIGAAIGTVIFPGIGTAIGAAIGGWVGTFDAFTIPLQQAFQAIGDTLGPIGQSLADVFGSIIHVIFSVISIFNPFIPTIQKATGAMDATTAVIIGFKIVLTPIIAAFQLLEQTLNVILIVFRAFEVGLLEARLALSRLNPFGDRQYQSKLRGEIVAANSRLADALKKPAEALERHKEWYNTPPAAQRATTTTTTAGGRRGRPAAAPAAPVPGPTGQAPMPPPEANPVPAIQALNTKQAGANVLLNEVKKQIAASSNNQQAKLREIYSKLSSGVSVRVTNTPTVKFDMGGIGPVGGGIGGFAKTSGYGMRWGKMHSGNDYGMPVGTKLGIGGPGKVLFAGNAGGYGKMMDIGGPGGMVYRFAHLSKFNAPVGATLPPGFPFALSGNTGRSTGPHLHFEARPGGLGPVNPDAFAGIIRAGYAGTPIGGLLSAAQMEASKMPYGSNLAIGNTDEIFMRPTQMASLVEGSTRAGVTGAGNFEVGKVEVTINDNTGDIARVSDQAAEMILQSMYRQARAEVITS